MRSAMKARISSSVRPARTWRAISSRMSCAATACEREHALALQVGHLIVSAMASMRSAFVRGWSRPLATTSVTTTTTPIAAHGHHRRSQPPGRASPLTEPPRLAPRPAAR